MDSGDIELLKHVRSELETGEGRLYEQVASTFKWLLATLFTANGGALVALLGNEVIIERVPRLALAFFAAGVVASVLMAVTNAAYATKALMPMTALKMALAGLAAGKTSMEEVQANMDALNQFNWLKWTLYGCGVMSFFCLIGGMISFACTA